MIRVVINIFLKGTVYEDNDTVRKLAEYESFPRYYAMFMDWFVPTSHGRQREHRATVTPVRLGQGVLAEAPDADDEPCVTRVS